MKQLSITLAAVGLMALCFVSCEKEPAVTISHFSATIEKCTDQVTGNAPLGIDNIRWNDSDKVVVYGSSNENAIFVATPNPSNCETAELSYQSGSVSTSPYKAIYPASIVTGNKAIELPALQKSVDGSLALYPMYGETSSEELVFKGLCGVLKVHLQNENTSVSSITVVADNVSGTFSINDATAVNSGEGGNTVTLLCKTYQSITGEGHDFFVCLPARTYPSLELKVANSEGGLFSQTYADVKVERGRYTTLSSTNMNFEIPEVSIVDGRLPGLFSVSDKKQVYFSMGNLQYQTVGTHKVAVASDTIHGNYGKWFFAEHQYDIIGERNAFVYRMKSIDKDTTIYDTTIVYGDTTVTTRRMHIHDVDSTRIDLFGWATSGFGQLYPYSFEPNNTLYGDGDRTIIGSNYDWGKYNAITNGGNASGKWRTLSRKEWEFLLYNRSNAANLCGTGTVAGVHGLILLPDSWVLPVGASFVSGFGNSASNWFKNVYTAAQWIQMEAAGAVFLPATGYRTQGNAFDVNDIGAYWSASYCETDKAYYTYFDAGAIGTYDTEYRSYGYAVRLVKD